MTTDEIAQKHESSGAAGYPREGWFELLVAVILGPGDVGLSLERLSIWSLEWHPNFPPCRVNRFLAFLPLAKE